MKSNRLIFLNENNSLISIAVEEAARSSKNKLETKAPAEGTLKIIIYIDLCLLMAFFRLIARLSARRWRILLFFIPFDPASRASAERCQVHNDRTFRFGATFFSGDGSFRWLPISHSCRRCFDLYVFIRCHHINFANRLDQEESRRNNFGRCCCCCCSA